MSKYIIDRRKNPKGKSISNRQRFIRRAKKHLSERIHKNVVKRSITDKGEENISIPTDGIQEPSFNHDSATGDYDFVLVNEDQGEWLDADINSLLTSDGVCMDGDDFEGIGCDSNSDCGSGYSCNEDDGINEISVELVLIISDDFDHTQDLGIEFVADDGTNTPVTTSISFDVVEFNEAPSIVYEVRETCGNSEQVLSLVDGVYQSYEDCEIVIDASTSTDTTSTGTLLYDWEELPFLDLDGDDINELDLSSNSSGGYYSTESTNILTIELPEHISENRTFDCEFSLGDGDLISESVELDFEIISSMPIVDEILETGLFYEYDDGYIVQDGFIYEGMIVELDASAFDPDGDDNSLEYTWDADGGASILILGHCDDLAGNINSAPCGTDADCQNCSDPQFITEDECLCGVDGTWDSLSDNGDGTFENVTNVIGLSQEGKTESFISLPFDFNEDGWMDLYVTNDLDKPNYMYINDKGNFFIEKI